jgi:hypothetical protein
MADIALAAPPVAATPDERWLDSLFARLDPSPAELLNAAVRFATRHPAGFDPGLMLTALQLRGAQESVAWLKKMNSTIGVQEVMVRTGLSKSGVHKAKVEDRMLAFRLQGQSFDHFPLFQFKEGMVREWIPPLLALTGNGLAAAHFLAVPRRRLQGRAYIDLLHQDDNASAITGMLRQAESIGDEARSCEPGAETAGSP